MLVRLSLGSGSQLGRKRFVGVRALVQAAPAGDRKARAPVPNQGAEDSMIAPRDQKIGDPLAQTCSVRKRQEMVLALAAGDQAEIALGESLRLNEHWTGHVRVVVQRKRLDEVDGRTADRR